VHNWRQYWLSDNQNCLAFEDDLCLMEVLSIIANRVVSKPLQRLDFRVTQIRVILQNFPKIFGARNDDHEIA